MLSIGIGPHWPCHRGDALFRSSFFERENKKKRLTRAVSKIEEFGSSVIRSAHL